MPPVDLLTYAIVLGAVALLVTRWAFAGNDADVDDMDQTMTRDSAEGE